jgi:hypothetical protein
MLIFSSESIFNAFANEPHSEDVAMLRTSTRLAEKPFSLRIVESLFRIGYNHSHYAEFSGIGNSECLDIYIFITKSAQCLCQPARFIFQGKLIIV